VLTQHTVAAQQQQWGVPPSQQFVMLLRRVIRGKEGGLLCDGPGPGCLLCCCHSPLQLASLSSS
jgi:hypothetical protein